MIPGHGAASAPWRALCPHTWDKVCRVVPAVPDPSAVVWRGCRDIHSLAPAQGPGTLDTQQGVQRVAAAGRLSAARCSAELCALTCPLRWSGACHGTPGTAAPARLCRGGQEGRSGCCGSSGGFGCSASLGLAVSSEPLRASCWPGAGGLGSCWHRHKLPWGGHGQQGSLMPSLPAGAVAGAAGGKAQDQARHFHGAHGPQVPAAVVPGECQAGAACCRARRGAIQSQQQVLGQWAWHRRDGGRCQPGWRGGGRPEAAAWCCGSGDT